MPSHPLLAATGVRRALPAAAASTAATAGIATAGPPPRWPASTIRSPGRSAAAPVEMICWPSLTPLAISVNSCCSIPMVTGWNDGGIAFAGRIHTPILPCISTTAPVGTTSAFSWLLDREAHARVHARLQPDSRVRNLDLHLRGPSCRIEYRRQTRATRPANFSPGYASTSISPAVP